MSKAIFVTIPASNYCEKARWAISLANIPFFEEKHAPILKYISTMPKGGKSVPLLQLPDTNLVLKDSSDILNYCAKTCNTLYGTNVDAIKKKELEIDTQFGPHARRLAYHSLFNAKNDLGKRAILDPLDQNSYEAMCINYTFPVLRMFLIKALNVTDEAADRSWIKVKKTFDEVDKVLGDGPIGTKFLNGSTFTASDLTFCSHASLLLGPKQNPYIAPYYADESNFSSQSLQRYHELKKTKAGQFVYHCYEKYYPKELRSNL